MHVRDVIVAGWLLLGAAGQAVAGQADSLTGGSAAADTGSVVSEARDSARVRNPFLAGALSLAAPGSGQFHNRQFMKGLTFMAVEAGLVFYTLNRLDAADKYTDDIARLEAVSQRLGADVFRFDTSTVVDSAGDTLVVIDTTDTGTVYRMCADTARHKREELRTVGYQAAWWAATCYVYAFLDALEKTGYFVSDRKKNPTLAGWLSAIPGLGLGQIYNGKLSKAGMILMVQTSLGFMAYNNHRLMLRCDDALRRLDDRSGLEYAVDLASGREFSREWETMRSDAFRTRNTYLWYSIFFYLYGIFDAVVDAHLHDFPARMRLEPDLQVPVQQVGMRLSFGLPSPR